MEHRRALGIRGDLEPPDGGGDAQLGAVVQAEALRSTECPPAVAIHLPAFTRAQRLLMAAEVLPGPRQRLHLVLAEKLHPRVAMAVGEHEHGAQSSQRVAFDIGPAGQWMHQVGLDLELVAALGRDDAQFPAPAAVLEDEDGVGAGDEPLEDLLGHVVESRSPCEHRPQHRALIAGHEDPGPLAQVGGRVLLGSGQGAGRHGPSDIVGATGDGDVGHLVATAVLQHEQARVVRRSLEHLGMTEVDDLLHRPVTRQPSAQPVP